MKIYPTSFTNVFGSSSQRSTVIRNMARKNPPLWSDFIRLEALLGADWNKWIFKSVDANVLEAMYEIAQRTTPRPLSYPLSESNLYNAWRWLRDSHGRTTASWNPENSETIDLSYEMRLVLSTVETILEKIGDGLPDETRIIESYLSSDYEYSLQCAGARLVLSTSKHKWRNSSKFIGRLIGLMNRKFSDDTYVLNPSLRKDIKRGIVSANPSYLFSKYTDVDRYICYEGKDPVMERILLGCANEDSSEVRGEAFGAIGEYLQRHEISTDLPGDFSHRLEIELLERKKHLIDRSSLDETLVRGVERRDTNALFALYHRFSRGVINNPKLFSLLMRSCDDTVPQNRMFAFTIISILLERENVDSPMLKPLCRKHFNDENEDVRVSALDLFGKILKRESVLGIETADVDSLENIGCNDSSKLAQCNAAYALAIVVEKDFNRIPKSQHAVVQKLCTRFKDYEGASQEERKTIGRALSVLDSAAEHRKTEAIRSIANPQVAEEVSGLFDLDQMINNELLLMLDDCQKELERLKKELALLTESNRILTLTLNQKELIIKELRRKLNDAVLQLNRYRTNAARKLAARTVLTFLGLVAPQFHILGFSSDILQTVHSITSNFSTAADVAEVVANIPNIA